MDYSGRKYSGTIYRIAYPWEIKEGKLEKFTCKEDRRDFLISQRGGETRVYALLKSGKEFVPAEILCGKKNNILRKFKAKESR